MSAFDREAFFARAGGPTRTIQAEGRTWHFRPMSAARRVAITDPLAEREIERERRAKAGEPELHVPPSANARFLAQVIAASLCDEAGAFVLRAEDADMLLDTFEQSTIERVGLEALLCNGMARAGAVDDPNAAEPASDAATNAGSSSA